MRIDGIIIDPKMKRNFDVISKIRKLGNAFITIGILGIISFLILFQLTAIGIILIISSF